MYSIFVFIAIGYIAKKLHLLGNRQSGILMGFLLNFAIPAQIFNGVYHADIDHNFLLICIISLCSNLLVAILFFILGKLLAFNKGDIIALCMLATLGNTLFLGFPLVEGILGKDYANQVIIYDQFVTGIPFAFLAPIVLAMGGQGHFSIFGVFKKLLKNPLFLSLIFGFLLRFLPFHIPDEFFAPLKSIAQTAIPLALFAVGVQIDWKGILNWKLTALLLSGKMILAPLFLASFVYFTYNEFQDIWRMALIEVAMPPQISAIAVLLRAGFNSKLALNAVVLGILLSFLTIPAWLQLSYFLG